MAQAGLIQEQFGWYEASLPLVERKKRGHFSTPPLLVEHILDACGYTPEASLAHLRVLDPACGSGNFLVAAAQRLKAFARRVGLSNAESIALLERNLWGFDPDPVSCFLAEMRLRMEMGDVPASLHIHQADSLVLSWEPCVDLFIANPPYLAARNTDLSGYRSTHRRGQVDSYLLFLNLALSVVRPGGWIGLVLPDPVLARANAAGERARLLEEMTVHHLWHLSGVFAAEVGAVVIIAQKRSPTPAHQVAWIRQRWACARAHRPRRLPELRAVSLETPGMIPQSVFTRQPNAELRYLLSSERGMAIERLRSYLAGSSGERKCLAPLGEFLSICRGEELGRESPWLSEMLEQSPHYRPVLRGGIDIHPYCIPHTRWQIARDSIEKPIERYLSPKLLVVKSTERLQATVDLHGHVALQTLYLLHLRDTSNIETLYFFLALLNSRLLREYVYLLHTAYKWVQPQIEQGVLARLPVPLVAPEERQPIIERAKRLVDACSAVGAVVEWDEHIASMYEELERAICALYDAVLPGLFAGAAFFTDRGVMTYG
ncbi:MAG TPA: N-6 DNA methylase [Ktedonobacteraceae bacterium]|jgi:SAM-dependent methyltransferase|nr:N-6 DNA methylase [Ktedonobacteraceae bacterium]